MESVLNRNIIVAIFALPRLLVLVTRARTTALVSLSKEGTTSCAHVQRIIRGKYVIQVSSGRFSCSSKWERDRRSPFSQI